MKRKRGAQPGNKNAYRHGFYSKYFNPLEKIALADIPHGDVTDAIDLMRVNMGRFMEAYTASYEELAFDDKHAAFRSLGLAAGVTASLVRIHLSTAKDARVAKEIMDQLGSIGTEMEAAEEAPE